MKLCYEILSRPDDPQFDFGLLPPLHERVVSTIVSVLARVAQWEPPTKWSRPGWLQEARQIAFAAALRALCEFPQVKGVELGAFIYQRTRAGVLEDYRHEWSYACRFPNTEPLVAEPLFSDEPSPDVAASYRDLRRYIVTLPRPQKRVLVKIFFQGHTESTVAKALGVTERAVRKCKRKALAALRHKFSGNARR